MESVVHIVDDDSAVRRSLAMLLGSVGYQVQTYATGEELLAAAVQPGGLASGCIMLDVRMPGLDGISMIEELPRHGVVLPVVIVTGHGDIPLAVRAMRAGALDFVEKPYAEDRILGSVIMALDSARESDQQRAHEAQAQLRVGNLSPREREVLVALVAGKANKVIGFQLGISPRTVEVHRAHLMEKLGVRSLPEAVRIGIAAGLAPED